MSDNHDLLNDNDMYSFSGYEADDMCFNNDIATCGDYCVATKEKLVEILNFRHFAKHFVFMSEGKKMRNKSLKNYFDVSVVVDIGCGNTNGN